MKERLKEVQELFNTIMHDPEYDIGFHVPHHMSEDPFVKVLLAHDTGGGPEVLAHLTFDEETERWSYVEGEPR